MHYMEDNSHSSSMKGISTFESGFEAIIDFFKDIKNKIVSLRSNNFKNDVENITENEKILESYKNIILSNLDLLIAFARDFENKDLHKNSYFLIRIKDMFSYVLFEKQVTIEEVDLLIDILTLYNTSLTNMKEIWRSEELNNNDKINKLTCEYEDFSNEFSEKEMEFYSLIDSDEKNYKNSISDTYDLLREID